MKLDELALNERLRGLIREGRKILQAAKEKDYVADTTAEKLAVMTSVQMLKLLKKVRTAAIASYDARKAKDWLQRSADAIRAHV